MQLKDVNTIFDWYAHNIPVAEVTNFRYEECKCGSLFLLVGIMPGFLIGATAINFLISLYGLAKRHIPHIVRHSKSVQSYVASRSKGVPRLMTANILSMSLNFTAFMALRLVSVSFLFLVLRL